MKRDEVRRPRASSQRGTRAAAELLPGPLGVPARSWLKARSARGCVTDRTKARPAAEKMPCLARREAPACRKARAIGFCASRRAIPPQAPDASRVAARRSHVLPERCSELPALPVGESTRSRQDRGEGSGFAAASGSYPLTLPAMRFANAPLKSVARKIAAEALSPPGRGGMCMATSQRKQCRRASARRAAECRD